jgi:hypothetical protein
MVTKKLTIALGAISIFPGVVAAAPTVGATIPAKAAPHIATVASGGAGGGPNMLIIAGVAALVGFAAVSICAKKGLFKRLRRKRSTDSAVETDIPAAPSPEAAKAAYQAPLMYPTAANGSTIALIAASAAVDPLAAKHASVVTVELIRHLQATAEKMQEKTSAIMTAAEKARDQGVSLNDDLLAAEASANCAHALLIKLQAHKEEPQVKHSAASLIDYRAQLDETISILADARIDLVAALTAWQVGMRKADAQRAEAEALIAQSKNFINSAVESSEAAGVDTGLQ